MHTSRSARFPRLAVSLFTLAAVGLLSSCKGKASNPPATPPAPASPAATAPSTPSPSAPAAVAAAPAVPDTRAKELSEIVTRYRKNIVLASDQASLDDDTRERTTVIGRMIFEQNRHALDELGEQFGEELTAAASSSASPAGISAFLEWLEKSPELRDGDSSPSRTPSPTCAPPSSRSRSPPPGRRPSSPASRRTRRPSRRSRTSTRRSWSRSSAAPRCAA